MIAASDTTGLTVEERARLAYALTVIRSTQTLHGWSQERNPLKLIKRRRGRIEQVWHLAGASITT